MDTPLKHRLIGAIVLVALAVIFLPALVKGPTVEGSATAVSLRVPGAPDEGQFQTRELPLVVPGGVTPSSLPAPVAVTDKAVVDAAEAAVPAAVAAGDYVVNYGAYDSQANARIVVDSLSRGGLKAFDESTTVAGRPAWRVRIGPFADRAAAEAARIKAVAINPAVKAQVVVLDQSVAPTPASVVPPSSPAVQTAPLPARSAETERPVVTAPAPVAAPVVAQAKPVPVPAPAKPRVEPAPAVVPPQVATTTARPSATAPAAASVGWAVQLGAFSNAAEANALRDRVRGSGFSAFVEQVPTDRGTLTRVRVGPVANRDDGEQLRARVAASLGISGMVVRHP